MTAGGGRNRPATACGFLCFIQGRIKDGEERRKDRGSKKMTGGSCESVNGW
jgi:hypothetical protein